MLTKIRLINLVLTVVALFQIALLLDSPSVKAQTAAFLKRPYYGPYVAWTAVFDHHCPDYDAAGSGTQCSEDTTYLYTYPNPDQYLNGLGRMLNYRGENAPSYVGDNNPAHLSYSGHSGYDFALAYKPVVASAPGQITASQWDNPNHETGYGLYVLVQHTPANPLHRTLYGHLSMVRYGQGQQVGYWQIGTSGNTGHSYGAHLHFELQRWSDTWKSKDMYGWSGNGADPWPSGGGVTSEWLWLDNREQTPPTYSGDYLLDNDDPSWPNHFGLGCNAGTGDVNCPYWLLIASGYNGDLRYTLPSGTNPPDYWAEWTAPNLPSTGQYEVEVFIPPWDPDNRSHAVRYEIVHQNGTQVVVVDQHDVSYGTWISLGRYNFNAGSIHKVRVRDAAYVGGYFDPLNDQTKKILVDAIRWRKTH